MLIIYSLFEDYGYNTKKYDYVFCNYILEHVYDPVQILKKVKRSIKKRGKIFITVPNCNAFSRILAQKIGIIEDLKALTENDHKHGHRRAYDTISLKSDLSISGYKLKSTKGVIFKILADFQLNKMMNKGIITEEHIRGLHEMAEGYDDFCDSIFVIGEP